MSCPFTAPRYNYLQKKVLQTPCGKCIQCRIAQRAPWEFRLKNELASYKYQGSFITATYDDSKFDVRLGLRYKHIQDWFKRVRNIPNIPDFSYYLCGEYGSENARPHWHILLFGVPISWKDALFEEWNYCVYDRFTVSPITPSRIRYTLKYMDKENFSKNKFKDTVDENIFSPFEYHIESGKLLSSVDGITPPGGWCSKNLGDKFFLSHFDELLVDGKFHSGNDSFVPSKHQLDKLTHVDMLYHVQRKKWNTDNEMKDLNAFIDSGLTISAWNNLKFLSSYQKELASIAELRSQGECVGDSYIFDFDKDNHLLQLDLNSSQGLTLNSIRFKDDSAKRFAHILNNYDTIYVDDSVFVNGVEIF